MATFSLAEKLYANKSYEDTVEVLGRKFTFKPLSSTDEIDISRQVDAASFVHFSEARKIPTLARCIVKIDGQTWQESEEIQQLLNSKSESGVTLVQAVERELSKSHYTSQIIDMIYLSYANFRVRYMDQIAQVKKSSNKEKAAVAG